MMGTHEISTFCDGTNFSTNDVIIRTSNTAFRVEDSTDICMNMIKKFKPAKLKRHDRNDGGNIHVGSIAHSYQAFVAVVGMALHKNLVPQRTPNRMLGLSQAAFLEGDLFEDCLRGKRKGNPSHLGT